MMSLQCNIQQQFDYKNDRYTKVVGGVAQW